MSTMSRLEKLVELEILIGVQLDKRRQKGYFCLDIFRNAYEDTK